MSASLAEQATAATTESTLPRSDDGIPKGLYVDGRWSASHGGGTRLISCPADGTAVATVAECSAADATAAVAAARRAFDAGDWATRPEKQRGEILLRTADLLARDKAAYARAEALDTGKRLVEAEYDISDVIASFRYFGGIAGTDAGRVVDTEHRTRSAASSMHRWVCAV